MPWNRLACGLTMLAASAAALSDVALSQVPITGPTVTAELPPEVLDGGGLPLPVSVSALPLDFFDDFSWRSFVALNWPAAAGGRGVPDRTKPISAPGPRVWETWKASYETILPTGAPPGPWDSVDGPTPCASIPPSGSGLVRLFGSYSHFGDLNQAGFGGLSGPLVCQNRTYTRYEVRLNQPQYEHIANQRLYLRSTLLGLTAPERFPDGSIVVKAAWREFGANDDQELRSRFYTVDAAVLDPPSGRCEPKQLGLVGLHIVHKTPLRPQWVWSSFEHVDNVPEFGQPPMPTDRFSYNSSKDPQLTDSEPPTLTLATFQASPEPNQIVRELPLHPAAPNNIGTEAMNRRYQAALSGTVWANYQLVVTQWPRRTHDPDVVPSDDIPGDPFPAATVSMTSVANTAMESYLQTDTSCMDCHDLARQNKTDFINFLHVHAFDDTFVKVKSQFELQLHEKKLKIHTKQRSRR
ncbi:MAG: hypothetical protein KF774_18035 [Planctomyces sp.]|nr:hypothetical protein [Planctomyces sp.]